MKFAEFQKQVHTDAEKKQNLQMWYEIHSHVCKHGQTDRYDRVLQKSLNANLGKWISDSEIKLQLRKMENAGLLKGHRITVKYTPWGKAMLPFGGLLLEDGPRAGAFIRYTLPGMIPTVDLQSRKTKKKKTD